MGEKIPLGIMNANIIYEKCKSRGLTTSFNGAGLRISYKEIKKHRKNLAKSATSNSKSNGVPMQTILSNEFSLGALDNYDHSDKNNLLELLSSHDTAMILFQNKLKKNNTKPMKSEVNVESIKSISKLPSQEFTDFHCSKTIFLLNNFEVSGDLYRTGSKYIKIGYSHSNVTDVPT